MSDNKVTILERRQGSKILLEAQLRDCLEATITLTGTLENMVPSARLPLTLDTIGRKQLVLVTFTPKNPTQRWKYDWHHDWKIGRRRTGPLVPFRYSLPFKGYSNKISQGPHGSFSHGPGSGSEEAIDWAMPVGTEIFPARSGKVVALRQDCTEGGPELRFKKDFNYVIIKHDDGTFAEYVHLVNKGVLVSLGQNVTPEKPIAYSGNTGFSAGPHLHFAVYYNLSGSKRQTLPITFG